MMTVTPRPSTVLFFVVALSYVVCCHGTEDFSFLEVEGDIALKDSKKSNGLEASHTSVVVANNDTASANKTESETPRVVSHQDLKGNAASPPCCATDGDGTIECFIRGKGSQVYYKILGSKEHPEWLNTKLVAVGDLECMETPDGKVLLLAISFENHLMAGLFDHGEFKGWDFTGAKGLAEVPSCVALEDDKIECLYRATSGTSFVTKFFEGLWEPPVWVGGQLSSPTACIVSSMKGMECFSAMTNHRLQVLYSLWIFQFWWPERIQEDHVGIQGRPCALSFGYDAKEVYARSVKNELVKKAWNDNGHEHNWEIVGGELESSPTCVIIGYGHVTCFAVNFASYFMFNDYVAGKWSGWKQVEAGMEGPPSCLQTGREDVKCYIRGALTASIHEIVFKV